MQVKFISTIFPGIAYVHIIQVIYLQFFVILMYPFEENLNTGKLILKIKFVACLFRQERRFHEAPL